MNETPSGRNPLRSTAAVFLGIFVVFVLSLGTDQVLHVLKIYPPWGEAMWDHRLNALALSYRIVYGVVGGFVTAKTAPRNPLRHAMIMGWIGFGLSVMGAIGGIMMKAGPAWYPIVLALTALPCAWLGGRLGETRNLAVAR
ncbi:MAG: hypothetical protein JWM88_1935 [Verrucomicrobia bacterium]|nr:hypothetical protein [Verrucomicrobiota bacterium]